MVGEEELDSAYCFFYREIRLNILKIRKGKKEERYMGKIWRFRDYGCNCYLMWGETWGVWDGFLRFKVLLFDCHFYILYFLLIKILLVFCYCFNALHELYWIWHLHLYLGFIIEILLDLDSIFLKKTNLKLNRKTKN